MSDPVTLDDLTYDEDLGLVYWQVETYYHYRPYRPFEVDGVVYDQSIARGYVRSIIQLIDNGEEPS